MKFFFNRRSKTRPEIEPVIQGVEIVPGADRAMDETAAVIALALHMYINQVREYEEAVITIQKILKPYSPWSSKIYGIRQQHIHRPALKPQSK